MSLNFGSVGLPFSLTTTPSFTSFGPSTFGGTSGTTFGPAPVTPVSNFGATTTALLSAPTLFTAAPSFASSFQQQQQTTQQLSPIQRLEGVKNSYDPQHPQCRFKHIFYNLVASPEEVNRHQQVKPQHIDPLLWDQAWRANPEPSRLVPVQATGFSDLRARIVEQDKMASNQEKALQDANKLLDHMKQRHEVTTLAKLEQYRRRELELANRVLKVMCVIARLEARGSGLTVGEEQFLQRIDTLVRDLSRPGFRGKLTELSAMSKNYDRSETLIDPVNKEALERIYMFLEQQQAGLQRLTALIHKDQKDFEYISNSLTGS